MNGVAGRAPGRRKGLALMLSELGPPAEGWMWAHKGFAVDTFVGSSGNDLEVF